MALELPNETVNLVLDAHHLVNTTLSYEEQHALIDHVARETHRAALGLIASRIITLEEIATMIGISVDLTKERIKLSGVEPIKTLGRHHLYTLEDVPRIAYAHLESTETVEYIPARIRMAIARVKNRRSIKALKERSNILFGDFNGRGVTATFEIDRLDAEIAEEECTADGWPNLSMLVRALLLTYLETFGDIAKLRAKKLREETANERPNDTGTGVRA